MDYNFHTHTARCGHAKGLEEDYILSAIAGGIKYMGFSEHFPLRLPNGDESYFRLPIAQIPEHIRALHTLRQRYADRLELHIGFEMEYYPDLFPQMLKSAVEYGAEYLILGQHYAGDEYPDGFHVVGEETNDPNHLLRYTDYVLAAMQTGVFTYVAHPDIIWFTGDESLYLQQMRRICQASVQYNLPLEINLNGVRGKRNYPDRRFWALAGEIGCPVTIGFDAHRPRDAYDEASIPTAKAMVQEFGLNYIGRPTLVPLK